MNLRCVKLLLLLMLMLIVGVVLTSAVARADWPDWGCTPLWRWTGYGFGDGYHQGCCRTSCGHLTATMPVVGDGWRQPRTSDAYRWSRPVPSLPGAPWPAAARATDPRLPSPAMQQNIPY